MKNIFKYIFIAGICLFSALDANSFGKRDTAYFIDGVIWNEVYYDMNNLHFSGFVPNFAGAQLPEDEVFIYGSIDDNHYVMSTLVFSVNIPKSGKGFKNLIQEDYPNIPVNWLNAKEFGAKYAVECNYQRGGVIFFTRFIATSKHLIKLSTSDSNQKRRDYFFNSFKIIN